MVCFGDENHRNLLINLKTRVGLISSVVYGLLSLWPLISYMTVLSQDLPAGSWTTLADVNIWGPNGLVSIFKTL